MLELTIHDVAAVADVAAAIAVVASLIYLGRQIHQNNAQTQASARYSFVEAYGQINLSMAQNRELASVVHRGLNGMDLDDAERLQFFTLVGQFLNTWAVLYDMNTEHHLPESTWELVRKDIIALLSTPGGNAFWNDAGRLGVTGEFSQAVDTILTSGETTYDLVPNDREQG